MYTDIYEGNLPLIVLFEQEVLLCDTVVPRNIVPEGWYCYDLQYPEDGPYFQSTMVREAECNHFMTVLAPIPLLEDGVEQRPTDGQLEHLFDKPQKLTLAEYCRKHGLPQPEDRRRFVLTPDPLPDTPPGTEQIMRDTVAAITGSDLYKQFLRMGLEDYYRMELSCILSAPEGSDPERFSATAVCLDGDGAPEDEYTYLFHPHTTEKPIQLWGANFDRDLFDYLADGSVILYMSMNCHAAVWCELEENGADSAGAVRYLQYCADNGITPEKVLEAHPYMKDTVEVVAQLMEQNASVSPSGITDEQECPKKFND